MHFVFCNDAINVKTPQVTQVVMGAARPIAFTTRINPVNQTGSPRSFEFFSRTRFYASCPLHLSWFFEDVSMDEVKNFRQWGFKTQAPVSYCR